jgi:hypothetical protein
LALLLILAPAWAQARGLSFSEQMAGYAYYQGEYRSASVNLQVVINDIDAWRSNANYAASITGTLTMDRVAVQPITGSLQILAPAPGDDGRLLTYRLNGNGIQFIGLKHVHDDHSLDLVDDITTLHGVFVTPGQVAPSVSDLLYLGLWTSELHFEWWKPAVLLDFTLSFKTLATPWYQDLEVKILFLKTVLGYLAQQFFPWAI